MHISLPYGTDTQSAEVPWGTFLPTLDVAECPLPADLDAHIRDALGRPIGLDRPLTAAARPGDRVVIIVSDSFRRTRIERVLPHLLEGLAASGVRERDISFVFATGSHRPPTAGEQERILGREVYARFGERAHPHDPRDEANLVHVGTTSRGTPVRLNRRAVEADCLIVTGAVVFHYFGGFGGGRKAILPGVAAIDTISHNHAMNLDPVSDQLNPAVRIGALDGNPVAEDMLEGSRLARCAGIVNTVLDRRGEIAGVFAGELDAAHRAACEMARSLYAAPIDERADLVIASSGPTKNYVQTHKALYNAYQAVKPEGRIILLARCEEGLGGEQFAQWVRLGSREAIIAALRRRSEINGQTALSTVEKAPIAVMVTDMAEADVRLLGARKAGSLSEALEMVRPELPGAPVVRLMPSAAYTAALFEETG